MLTLLYIAFLHISSVVKAQRETRFFVDRFNKSDWQIDNTGLYSNPINWIESTTCSGKDDKCLTIKGGGAIISKTIPTTGYHSIFALIDMYQVYLDSNEYCYIEYKTDKVASWTRVNLEVSGLQYDLRVTIPNNDNYNDQASFTMKLGNSAGSSEEVCYFEDLEVFGTPYNTTSPTTTREPAATPIAAFVPTTTTTESAEGDAANAKDTGDGNVVLMMVVAILSTMVFCGCIGIIIYAVWRCKANKKVDENPNKSVNVNEEGNVDRRAAAKSVEQMEMEQKAHIEQIESLVNSTPGFGPTKGEEQNTSDINIWD